ncbi:MAG: hypothetical protein WDN69_05415 [Aliidongia sp.]
MPDANFVQREASLGLATLSLSRNSTVVNLLAPALPDRYFARHRRGAPGFTGGADRFRPEQMRGNGGISSSS